MKALDEKIFYVLQNVQKYVPNYLCELLPKTERSYNSFLPSAIIEWNKLKIDIRNSVSLDVFKKKILTLMRIWIA